MLEAEQGSGGRGEAEAPARRPCVPSPHLCPVSLQITHGRSFPVLPGTDRTAEGQPGRGKRQPVAQTLRGQADPRSAPSRPPGGTLRGFGRTHALTADENGLFSRLILTLELALNKTNNFQRTTPRLSLKKLGGKMGQC